MACLAGYFCYHVVQGERGLLARLHLEQELRQLKAFNLDLTDQRQELESRVALLRRDRLDLDMLEEQARKLLNYGHPDDLVLIAPSIEYTTLDEHIN